MAKSRKNTKPNNGAKLYNKILKEFTKVNKGLPEDRQLSLEERRKYISEKIYPQFKGTHPSKVGVKVINKEVLTVLDTILPKEGCDVNLLSPSTYTEIMWFELDDYIQNVLPKCIYIRVDADNLGSTKIFNTLNYDYNRSGLRAILDKLRTEVNNSSSASFTGIKKLKKGKPNDGTPENYFIDFVLVLGGIPSQPIEPVIVTLNKEQKKKSTSIRNVILTRVKELNNKKKRKKRARKKALDSIKTLKDKNKRLLRAKSKDYKNRLIFERIKEFLKAKKSIQTAYNRGNMTKEQYDKYNDEIDRLIEEVKRQGGII